MLSVHKFEGGASVWCEKGDQKSSAGILEPGRHDYGIATRDERIIIVRGKGKINRSPVKWNADGDDPETNVANIRRGEKIIIEVAGDSEMVYLCDYGPKIFHEIFARPVETLGLDAATINFAHEFLRVKTVGELAKASNRGLMQSNPELYVTIQQALEKVGLTCPMLEDDMLKWTVEQEQKATK